MVGEGHGGCTIWVTVECVRYLCARKALGLQICVQRERSMLSRSEIVGDRVSRLGGSDLGAVLGGAAAGMDGVDVVSGTLKSRVILWATLRSTRPFNNVIYDPSTMIRGLRIAQAANNTKWTACRTFSLTTSPLEKALPPRRKIFEDEITEAFLKGSGPGGQKINKTSSAVQLRHLPTGIVVKCQETRSREQNRKMARQELGERLDQMEKGDRSRLAIKAERARGKKASADKKKKRKYRKLEEGKEGNETTETTGEEGAVLEGLDEGLESSAASEKPPNGQARDGSSRQNG